MNGATLTTDRDGNANSAYNFNYSNWSWGSGGDRIIIPYNTDFNSANLSVSVWATRTSNGYPNQNLTIVNRFQYGYSNPNGQAWQVLAEPAPNSFLKTQIIQGAANNTQANIVNTGPLLTVNDWFHIVLTFDGLSAKQYINGTLVDSIDANGITLNTSSNSGISIGVSNQANGQWGPFDGVIDDLGLWNRALSPAEIQALYTGTVNYNPNSAYVNNKGCIVCDQYAVGDTFSLDSGATWYTVVDRALLEQKRDAGDDLSKVCVSLVTDMSNLFQAKSAFNDNISGWDVSNVTDMEYMFLDAQAFNDTIGNWDVSNVNNMAFMFKGAHAFDQSLNQWDVSAVSNMRQLFFGASSFNSPIDFWDVSGVINMQGMFQGAAAFNQPIGGWEVGSVTNMNSMFYNTYAFDQDLTGWCVSNISSLPTNFAGNSALQSIHYPQWGSCPCNIVLDLGPDTVAVCGSSYTLDAGAGYSSYAWSTGATTRSITVSSSGLYSCTVSNSACAVSDTLFVNLLDASITISDSVVCAGDSVTLSAGGGMVGAMNKNTPSTSVIDSTQVDAFTMTFNSAFNHNTPSLDPSKVYLMKVTGRYGIADAWSHNDAAYNYAWDTLTATKVWCNGSQDARKISGWRMNSAIMSQRPINDSHNNCCFCSGTDKTYRWIFTGLSGVQSFSFSDCCYGDNSGSLQFSIHEVVLAQPNSGGNYSYNWSTGDTTASITANPTQTTTYYCTVSDGISTCTDSVTVYVSPLPALDLGPDTVAVCGSSYTLDAGAGFSSYLWSTGDSTQTTTISSSGLYFCTVGNNGCYSTDSVYISLLDASITASDSVLCAGDSVTLSVSKRAETPIPTLVNALRVPSDYQTIQTAINAAITGDTILVSDDIYYENDLNFYGKDIVLLSQNGPDYSIIDGGNSGGIIDCISGESFNCEINGFTLQNGNASIGSAIHIINSSYLTVKNCYIKNNSAPGIWTRAAISIGHAYNNGPRSPAGIQMFNCVLEGNSGYYGGAVFNEESGNTQSVFEECVFKNNTAYHGSAIYGTRNSLIKNCLFTGNDAGTSINSVLQNEGGTPTIINCTFAGNNDYAIGRQSNNNPTIIVNSIFYDNLGTLTQTNNLSLMQLSYSLDEDNNSGVGMISGNPLFVNPANNDFSLLSNSPCLDSGHPDLNNNGQNYFTDFYDQDPDGTRMDIGAFYYSQGPVINPIYQVTGSSNLSYNWSTGDTTASITANPTQTTTYYCTVSDGISTCTDSITVYVSSLPALDLGPDTVAVCGSSYTLDAGAGFSSYLWSTGDSTQTTTISSSGLYFCTVGNNGCYSTDSVYISILDASITASDSVVCTGDSVTLSPGGGMGSASSSSLPAYLPTNGLVAWYPFNGNANDESGNGNNGTVNGATLTADRDGNVNSAYDFDGNDWIVIPNNSQLNFSLGDEYSLSFWINSSSSNYGGSIIEKWNNSTPNPYPYTLRISNGNIISANRYNGVGGVGQQVVLDSGISADYYHHIVALYKPHSIELYINGILEKVFLGSYTGNIQGNSDIFIGRRGGVNWRYFHGVIDDIAIYNRALSPSEIQSLYTGQTNSSNRSYVWSTGDTTASITANPTQTTTYYCTVSDGISTCTDSVTVYVSPLPALDLGLDTVAVCGSSYTLDAGAGFDQYQWNTGDTSQTIVVNQSGSYTVTATSNGSCSAIDSVYVHLLNIPIEASSSAICAGSSVELAARYVAGAIAPAPAMPGFTYHGIYKEQYIYASNSATSWPSARQACLSRGGDLIVIRDAGENTDYYAMASQYFGNLGSWIGLTDEAQEGVWTWVDGSLLGYSNWASGEPNNFGGNEDYANFTTSGQWNDRGSRNLYYLMAIPVQVASYAWSTGDSIPAISVSPTQTTTYYCTVSDGIATCTDSVTIQVTPVPAFDLGTDTLALCGTQATLDAGSGFDSYLWSTGDTTQSIVVEASGNYSCMVTLQSCTLTDSIQVILQGVEINAFLSTITTWRQMGMDIDGELAGDRFGVNVSLSADGSRLAAGAHFNDGNGNFSGHTRVFNWDGANWVQMGSDIDGEAAGDRSGVSVSLSANGNRLAIGAYQNDGNGSNAGQTRIFEWNGSSWNQLGADIDGEAANDWAGWSVSLSGDGTRVAIGAFQNDGNGADAGHARVYEWDGSQWSPMGSDLDGEAAGDGAGASVALSSDGSRLAVGAYKDDDGGLDAGSVQVYQWDGSSWLPLGGRLHGEGAEDYFGWSTDLSANGQRLAVGAYQNDGNGSNAGHTRVFEWDGSAWQQLGNDIDGEAAGDFSGISVALTNDGQSVAVGAHQNDGSATNAGHARLYRWDGSQWNTVSTDVDGEAAGDLSGHSIAIAADGLRLASGARVNAGSGLAAGHVRVYSLDTYWDPFISGTPRNQLICSGDSIALEAMTDAIAGTRFLWSTGDTTSSITIAPNQSGTYSCLVSNGSFSCVDSIRVDIASPSLDLGPDTVIICGSSYTLDAGPGLETYQWSTGGANQMLTVSRSGWYSCTVTQSGCTVRDSIYVHLLNASITASSACVSMGDSVSVSAISNSGLPLRYLWSTGDTTQTIWVTPTQQTALSCVVSDGITNCTAATTIQLGDWQPQATLLDNSYTTRFTWPTRNTARYNLHLREVGQSSWTNYVQTGLTKNLRNLEPGEYEFYVTAYNSIISGVDTSCMGYFTQECADISYSYNAFQAPELGRLGRVRVFGTQGGKRLYDIHLVNQEGDSTSVYNARQSNFTQLKDGRYTIYVQDDLGCSSDSIARFVIDPIDTTRVPYLIGAPNNPPNGFRPTWNSVDGIINYQLRVLNVTDGTLQDFVTGITDTNYAVTNLPTGKLYRFNVRSRYNKGISVVNSGYSNPVSRNLPLTGNKGGHSSPTTLVEHGAQWLVYPNPTDGKLYVQAPLGSQLVLVDMNGKRLAESTVVATEEVLDLSVLAQGVYLLQIIHQDQVHQERIVKQ